MRSQFKERVHRRDRLVVAAIASSTDCQTPPSQIRSSCDLVELRLDYLGWGQEVRDFAASLESLPILVTARGREEGGKGSLSVEERALAYDSLLPWTTALDIELADHSLFPDLLERARSLEISIIGSYHNFDQTPPPELIAEKLRAPADIHKFACLTERPEDLMTLFMALQHSGPVSAMGMGPLGGAARPVLAQAGSVLNYGSLGETTTAPGQWPARLLKEAVGLML